MDDFVLEYQYDLKRKFNYAKSGESKEASFILLKAPNSTNRKECAQLKQAFFRSLPEPKESTDNKDEDSVDIKAGDVMVLIARSPNVDYAEFLEIASKLMISNVALVDGDTKLTIPIMNQMSNDDVEGMVGEYMVNFILASALTQAKDS